MKQKFRSLCVLLALCLMAAALAGCTEKETGSSAGVGVDSSATSETEGASSGAATSEATKYDYSKGLDENGYWDGVKAKDYVELFDYNALQIPAEEVAVTDEEVQADVNGILSGYSSSEQVTDRAVADKDTLNIDYVGSVDGEEFSGGSTDGAGVEVTIGETAYIDDFLEQLIGHKPGETFEVHVTFPDEYPNNTELEGKDAVFVTTINYIIESTLPELTDAFVEENLSESRGWKTIAEMETELRESLKKGKVQNYVQNYINTEITASSIPEEILKKQDEMTLEYYEQYAEYSGMSMEDFLATMEVSSTEELLEKNRDSNMQTVTFGLVIQAIAEDMGITPTDEDIQAYFDDMGASDYSAYEEEYGMPYLKQAVLSGLVINHILDNAVVS